jgi:lipoprotein-anchoring transpeptidase ErfK/SrfK
MLGMPDARVSPFLFAVAILLTPTAAAGAEVFITVDKSAQQMTVRVDGALRWTWDVSTGRRGHETPSGTHTGSKNGGVRR